MGKEILLDIIPAKHTSTINIGRESVGAIIVFVILIVNTNTCMHLFVDAVTKNGRYVYISWIAKRKSETSTKKGLLPETIFGFLCFSLLFFLSNVGAVVILSIGRKADEERKE